MKLGMNCYWYLNMLKDYFKPDFCLMVKVFIDVKVNWRISTVIYK